MKSELHEAERNFSSKGQWQHNNDTIFATCFPMKVGSDFSFNRYGNRSAMKGGPDPLSPRFVFLKLAVLVLFSKFSNDHTIY